MRLIAGLIAALAAAPAAHGASLVVVPREFSPRLAALSVSASVPSPQPIGVELARPDGRVVGWLAAPAHRQTLSLLWDGRVEGAPVPDGRYRVRLVVGRKILASSSLVIDSRAPELAALAASSGSRPFARDTPLLTTVSPNGDGYRDRAAVGFELAEPATVSLSVARTTNRLEAPVHRESQRLPAGSHTLYWAPSVSTAPRTYVLRLTAVDDAGNTVEYGSKSPFVGRFPRAPVVRVQGIDAGFTESSYAPFEVATLRVATDAPAFTAQVFHSGPEHVFTDRDNVMYGTEVTAAGEVNWSRRRDAPGVLKVGIGPWRSGLYFVQLTAPDGRDGFSPFVVRPAQLGAESRVAVVLPLSTWQAYNFWDETGDGWGDTWYAKGPHRSVRLGRPYLRRGVIPFFRRYDLPFLHWLEWGGKKVEYLADTDLEDVPTGDALAAAYDLVVFPGHTEYVTEHVYDVVTRYRDLGGNLAFLSANNFFWRVEKTGDVLRRTALWRALGRPESALLGVQYIGNDEGSRQGVFVVRNFDAAPWLWDKTGLEPGSTFGEFVGGYGIEIDATTPASPPGTVVLAEIPDLFGPGQTAQMTYYETAAGAKVFSAGALDFGGSATFWPMKRMLDNLWARLVVP